MNTQSPPDYQAQAPHQGQLPQNLTPRQAKALAKAGRPWYAKKRFWLLGVIGVLAIVAVASNSGRTSGTGAHTQGGVSTLSSNAKYPPQADVTLTGCAAGTIMPDVKVTITNHSPERSNYLVSLNLLDASGTKIGEGTAASNNVEPAQTAIEDVLATANGTLATCNITEVNRFASK
jgi:hypothetical protein